MSDRIGVMRTGRLVQVGTPQEIYTAPSNKFVSEFMGDVNIIDVELDAGGQLKGKTLNGRFAAPAIPPGFRQGHLVVRPEYLRIVERPGETENQISGTLYNEYALGSRIQYQVRVGEQVFTLERLRQQAYEGRLDEAVTIGWDARDFVLVSE